MNPEVYSHDRCSRIVDILHNLFYSGQELRKNISVDDINQLYFSCETEGDKENNDRFSEPMVWIGVYISVASFFCVLAMGADLLHGFRNKKLWFPSKYFTLNTAFITVITVAMKLPVDLSSGMPSFMDQAAKIGSLTFMCVMMANLMPSLASMDNKTLLPNVIGLAILVITMIVNICTQIYTSVIITQTPPDHGAYYHYVNLHMVTYIYVAMTLLLLIIIICSSLTIPSIKEILESKYQSINKISLIDQRLKHIQMSTLEKLRQHVRRYWVLAETGSPQFVMASNPLSIAACIICVLILLLRLFGMFKVVYHIKFLYDTKTLYGSPYKWSTIAIYITQSVGVIVGTMAPIFRCFSVFSFKLVTKWSKNHFMIFKLERYWTEKLYEWKESPVPFLSSSRRSRSLIGNSKIIILSFCIGFQKVIVVLCKVIWLIATVAPTFLARYLFSPPMSSRREDIDKDLRNYVLEIDNEMEIADKTLERISNSMNSFMLKAAKEQNNDLLELLEKSSGFKGVEMFDVDDHVQPLLPIELPNTWSLPIVTLTCIVVALPNIRKDVVGRLLRSVGEGLSFTHIVEESLNTTNEYANIQKTALILWDEVESKCRWLGNPLAENVFKGKTATEIVKWFSDKAKEIVTKINKSTNGDTTVDKPPKMLIAANSMFRITQTILHRSQSNIEPITKKQLFANLSGMIADIFCACFTNIPRVITMRCHESVIEKREASVKVAAKLLGKTRKIIERLETCEVPSMDGDKMAYVDEWRLYLKQSVP